MKVKTIVGTFALITLVTLTLFFFYYNYNRTVVKHEFKKIGYGISVSYIKNNWDVDQKDIENQDEYTSFLYLEDKEKPREKYISFRYELLNNGDDTPHEVGDTGGGLWPPQPEELMFDFDPEEYTYIGTYLGKELYVTKPNVYGSVAVVQKLDNGKVTGVMPLLSKDKNRVNYYDSFSISAELGEEKKTQKRLYREFLKILKSMRIEKISETKSSETKTTS